MSVEAPKPEAWDVPLFWLGENSSPEERSQYYTIGNAINFRFWEIGEDNELIRLGGEVDGKHFGGAMYMWRCLRRAYDKDPGVISAERLENLTRPEFDEIFSDDDGVNPLRVGAEDRIMNLRDLGYALNHYWDGQFLNVVKESEGDLLKFTRLSSDFRAFDDPIVKLPMLNAIMQSGSGITSFTDEPLPAIDYHLARHALRQGLVEPEPELAQKLRDGVFITEDESESLRRAALTAYIELGERSGLSGAVIDNKYWLNRNICGDPPVCADPATESQCPFAAACPKKREYGFPLEETRYY
jgi:hypothetical protein